MSEDSELARLKARRLAEMQRNMSSRGDGSNDNNADRGASAGTQQTPPGRPDYRKILLQNLGYRGAEVVYGAESQFPAQAGPIIHKLGEMVASGELRERLDGGRLLALFRSVGLYIRIDTKIHVEKDGELVSLSDRLGDENDENENDDNAPRGTPDKHAADDDAGRDDDDNSGSSGDDNGNNSGRNNHDASL